MQGCLSVTATLVGGIEVTATRIGAMFCAATMTMGVTASAEVTDSLSASAARQGAMTATASLVCTISTIDHLFVKPKEPQWITMEQAVVYNIISNKDWTLE